MLETKTKRGVKKEGAEGDGSEKEDWFWKSPSMTADDSYWEI